MQKYYVESITNELNSGGYEEVDSISSQIIDEHKTLLGESFDIDEEHSNLPYIYWLPKQHKVPPKCRFVVSGKFCTLKSVSKSISKALKVIQKCIGFRCSYDFKFEKSSAFWIIDNSVKVHDSFNEINRYHMAKSVNTYDFSTLYTMIPHDKLIERIEKVVRMGFDTSKKNFIRVNKRNATWAEKLPAKPSLIYYDIENLMERIKFLLNNLYIIYGGKIYKQVIGIPIGSDCSQDLANLFLFSYEYDHVKSLKDEGNDDAELLGHSHRYIDDLLTLNDIDYMDRICSEIYPNELVLNKTNSSTTTANYLDLKISIDNNKFKTELYDKRNEFSFKVISLPHMDSNVPARSSYGVFTSQVYRLFRANSGITGFYNSTRHLMDKLLKQGFNSGLLKYHLAKFLNKHFLEITFKYWEIVEVNKF